MERRSFGAMGTEVELFLDVQPGELAERAFDRVEAEFERLEQVLSRFRDDSELTLLNREGRIGNASPDLVQVVALAIAARDHTGGLFDPTVHDAVVAAGYDRTFRDVPAEASGPVLSPAPCGGSVRIDGPTIELDPGTHLDLGGIGKGTQSTALRSCSRSSGHVLVNAGGDLAVMGGAWPVGVTPGLTLELTRGAIATSGRDRRRWRVAGKEMHHLIDPATGRPAEGDVVSVTVVADSAAEAEVLAKAAFLGAPIDVPHVLVTTAGETILGGGLAA